MKPRHRARLRGLELLESRLVPARVLHYTDIDGDRVTVAVSAGDLTDRATIVGGQLQLLDIGDPMFNHVNVAIRAVKSGNGDGLAAVGRINGGSNDLGVVFVQGDLGDIDCGSNSDTGRRALGSLSVHTLGRYGVTTQGGNGDLQCNIFGPLGSLTVAGDMKEAFVSVIGSVARIGSVTIGGSLIGVSYDDTGKISCEGNIGVIKIGGDVQGGSGSDAGSILALGKLAALTIDGSLIGSLGSGSASIVAGNSGQIVIGHNIRGGAGGSSAFIQSLGKLAGVTVGGSLIGGSNGNDGVILSGGPMGAVKIAGDVQGGAWEACGLIESGGLLRSVTIGGSLIGGSSPFTGLIFGEGGVGPVTIGGDVRGSIGKQSGLVQSLGKLARVTIGGSLIGGKGNRSGAILSGDDIGAITIGGDLQGGGISPGDSDLNLSGAIQSDGRIASVDIGGSILAGFDDSADSNLIGSATIRAANDIGSLAVGGSVLGSVSSNDGERTDVIISARGRAAPTASSDLAIGKISIAGRVERAQILAGYDVELEPINGNAQIGAVRVGGDWIASDLIAGAQDNDGDGFGDADDTIIFGGVIARIASIVIDGTVFGSVTNGEQFGFESHAIGRMSVNGVSISTVGPVGLSPLTGYDVTVRPV